MEPDEARDFHDQLRSARAMVLRDAEGYQEILFVIERLGMWLCGKVVSLGGYENHLKEIARSSSLACDVPEKLPAFHSSFGSLYEALRNARNDAMHQGAVARTLTRHAVQLALILEDALMSKAETVADFMVRDPVVAKPWQPVSFLRQQMLESSFSFLPFFYNDSWYFVSEFNVAKYLRGGDDRTTRLAARLSQVALNQQLKLLDAVDIRPDVNVDAILDKLNQQPLLVLERDHEGDDEEDHLVGILTASDVL